MSPGLPAPHPRPRRRAPPTAPPRHLFWVGRELTGAADLIVPVRLHWRRQWSRRFNQSALLADVIAKASGLPVSHRALKRLKATAQQVGLARSERAQNVQGAFGVRPGAKSEVA